MRINYILAGIILLLLPYSSRAQLEMPDGRYKVLSNIVNGDTIPIIYMAPVEIVGTLSPEAAAKMQTYLRLRRDVLKAYPYAKLAAVQLKFINDSISKIPDEHDRKRFIKDTEKQLKADFEKDLKGLTMTQGRILIKLIDRETGSTSYSLVRELRGSLQAFFWQGLAKLFGSSLKSEYDSAGDDAAIESIVQQIERGQLTVQSVKHVQK